MGTKSDVGWALWLSAPERLHAAEAGADKRHLIVANGDHHNSAPPLHFVPPPGDSPTCGTCAATRDRAWHSNLYEATSAGWTTANDLFSPRACLTRSVADLRLTSMIATLFRLLAMPHEPPSRGWPTGADPTPRERERAARPGRSEPASPVQRHRSWPTAPGSWGVAQRSRSAWHR